MSQTPATRKLEELLKENNEFLKENTRILRENQAIMKENNRLLLNLDEKLRKIIINTSGR